MTKKQKQFIKECIQAAINGAVDFQFSTMEHQANAQSSRIAKIETREEKNAVTLNNMLKDLSRENATLASQIYCGVKTGHSFSVYSIYDSGCRFRCTICELEYTKSKENLNEREQDLLKAVLGTQIEEKI